MHSHTQPTLNPINTAAANAAFFMKPYRQIFY